jgi:hypothetical protein
MFSPENAYEEVFAGLAGASMDITLQCASVQEYAWRWSRSPGQGRRHHTTTHEQAVPGCGGSGDEQAKAKLCCVEIDEVAIAFGPPT